MDLLTTLIISSEKAANIARLLRKNEKLFEKLVEQKSSAEANPRFQEDFKTLADVLIQEMVKYDVGSKFPEIRERVQGEENNRFFSCELETDITVIVKNTQEATAELLFELTDNQEFANLLAAEVHRVISLDEVNTKIPDQEFTVDVNRLGIWIDPIDGTNEYVKGGYEKKVGDFYMKGLNCVTVLIGVYDSEGEPVMGVINQPFFDKTFDEGYQCHWGVCIKQGGAGIRISSINNSDWKERRTICIGGGESEMIVQTLTEGGYKIIVTRGAGYKLLTVVLGLADAYVVSKPTIFFWDTCSPQAILRALGGNLVEMKGLALKRVNCVIYKDGSKCNTNGVIAYRNEGVLNKLLELNWSN